MTVKGKPRLLLLDIFIITRPIVPWNFMTLSYKGSVD